MLPRHRGIVLLGAILTTLAAAVPASAQQSRNVTLLANQNLHSRYTGSWPYIHTDGREYVAAGTREGTSIVRLTDPSNPVEVAFIPGPIAGIREVGQYQTYLYVVGLGQNVGIQVISMADPDNPVVINTVLTTERAENVTIDTARGYLYTTESIPTVTLEPGLHIYSLADPTNPVRIGVYENYGVHDITVKGTRGYACDSDLNMVHILDLTNPATPVELAAFPSAIGITHTAVPSADDRYLFVQDENFLETYGRPLVYDIQNLSKISLVFSFDDIPTTMPHFPYVEGTLLYVAYYAAGVRVYDVSDPLRPVNVAFYDTWPGDDGLFTGVYEATPFPSGIFTASDQQTGLYVFQRETAYGLVRGTVRAGNKPVSGATVRVLPDGPTFLTGASGYYGIAAPSGGSVTVECSKFGYATQTAILPVAIGSQQTRDFALSALATGTLKGTVRRASDMGIVAGAEVSLLGTPAVTTTTSMGKYTLSKIPVGNYTIRAEGLPFSPAYASANLMINPTITTDFALVPAPFYDDGETDLGWTLGEPDDDATSGRWVREAPIEVPGFLTPAQPGEDHSPSPGTRCFVTGNAPATQSLLGGKTTLTSPSLDLSTVSDPRVTYWLWFYNEHWLSANPSSFTTQISNDGGASWIAVSTFMLARAPWVKIQVRIQDYIPIPSNVVRLRFIAENRISGPVEALIDDFKVVAGPPGGGALLAAASPPANDSDGERPAFAIKGTPLVRGHASWAITLRQPAILRAELFDVHGRLVERIADGPLPAGDHILHWEGRLASGASASSGVYWLRVRAGEAHRAVKVIVAR